MRCGYRPLLRGSQGLGTLFRSTREGPRVPTSTLLLCGVGFLGLTVLGLLLLEQPLVDGVPHSVNNIVL